MKTRSSSTSVKGISFNRIRTERLIPGTLDRSRLDTAGRPSLYHGARTLAP